MVDYHYDDNIFKQLAKRRRWVWFVTTIVLLIAGVIAYIIYDGLKTQTIISNPPAEVQATLADTKSQSVFDEETFRLTTDDTWQKVEVRDPEYDQFVYHSFSDGVVRRELSVYVNDIPQDFALTHVLPVEIVGSAIVPLNVSPKCDTLQENKKNKRDVAVRWAGVNFVCDPDMNAPIVGTSHNEMDYNLRIKGQTMTNTYFFVYKDLEPSAQLALFDELLKAFEFK